MFRQAQSRLSMPRRQRGLLLLAAVVLIVVVAALAAVLTYLFSGNVSASADNQRAGQALLLAESGLEFGQRNLAQNQNWYRTPVDPITATQSLGTGTFTVAIRFPATSLRTRIPDSTTTGTIRVYSVSNFPSAGFLQVDDDMTSSGEFVQYNSVDTVNNTFNLTLRGATIGTITNPASVHARGNRVYPVTTLVDALANSCVSPTNFRIVTHSKFLSAGTIDIEGEEISYTGSVLEPPNTRLTGITRCLSPGAAHSAGRPVTPVLFSGDSADFQAEVSATGSVDGTNRYTRKVIDRSL